MKAFDAKTGLITGIKKKRQLKLFVHVTRIENLEYVVTTKEIEQKDGSSMELRHNI